jgi:hypothetical protein
MTTDGRGNNEGRINGAKAANLRERLGLLMAPLRQAAAVLHRAGMEWQERRREARLRRSWRGD